MCLLCDVTALQQRPGPRPRTTPSNPHTQLSQNAAPAMQERLFSLALTLAGVRTGPSGISVPGARAFLLDAELARGPREAFMAPDEFAHIHPVADGSLHMNLPVATVEEVCARGWGEVHPWILRLGLPKHVAMIYGPRDEAEDLP
jgi:phospholipase/carboxylesterase